MVWLYTQSRTAVKNPLSQRAASSECLAFVGPFRGLGGVRCFSVFRAWDFRGFKGFREFV